MPRNLVFSLQPHLHKLWLPKSFTYSVSPLILCVRMQCFANETRLNCLLQNGQSKLKPSIKDTTFVYSSYKDNIANIAPQSVKTYEEYKETKPSHYWNMIRGLVPEVLQGKIYKNWEVIDSLPEEARLVRYGLDFGYTNDPTAIIAIYKYNNSFILDEVCYMKGLSNKQIADMFLNLPHSQTVFLNTAYYHAKNQASMANI